MSKQVAIITGGASGMGLHVAEALAKRGDWSLHLLDLNEKAGVAAEEIVGGKFWKTNVTDYKNLSSVFDQVHKLEGRLDFVFANAGIVERWNFYDRHEQSPPPEPDQLSIDIDYKSVVSTTYLTQHYFRLSKLSYGTGKQCLIMTASCGGLYPSPFCPMYSGAKHAVVGFMRSVAKHFFVHDKIRVSCTCPGTVRTNLLDQAGWDNFPDDYFTPVGKITEVLLMLIDGGELTDSKGKVSTDWGVAAEINGKNHYFRDQPEWCDAQMEAVMKATDVADSPKPALLNGSK